MTAADHIDALKPQPIEARAIEGDECPCPVCQSDCAAIVPCQREADDGR